MSKTSDKIESDLEQEKMQQNILKNPLTHIVLKENTPNTSTEPYDDADDEVQEDPVDKPETIEEHSRNGILENNDDDNSEEDAVDIPE